MTRRKQLLERKRRANYKHDLAESLELPYIVRYKKEGVQHLPVSTPRIFKHLAPFKEHRCDR